VRKRWPERDEKTYLDACESHVNFARVMARRQPGADVALSLNSRPPPSMHSNQPTVTSKPPSSQSACQGSDDDDGRGKRNSPPPTTKPNHHSKSGMRNAVEDASDDDDNNVPPQHQGSSRRIVLSLSPAMPSPKDKGLSSADDEDEDALLRGDTAEHKNDFISLPPPNQLVARGGLTTPPRPLKTYLRKHNQHKDVTMSLPGPGLAQKSKEPQRMAYVAITTGSKPRLIARKVPAARTTPSPALDRNDHRLDIEQSSPRAARRGTATNHNHGLHNIFVERATGHLSLSSPGGGSPGKSPTDSPAGSLVALTSNHHATNFDLVDLTLVKRANDMIWPLVKSKPNQPGKSNLMPPGEFLVRPDWGDVYIEMVELYLNIEKLAPTGSLSHVNQPFELAYWKKRHRFFSLRDNISNADSKTHQKPGLLLPEELQAWWVSLQPPKRILPSGALSSDIPTGLDWSSLRVGGGNGLLVLVVGIAMWRVGMEAGKLGGSVTQWETLINDVRKVFAAISLMSPKAPLSPPCTQPLTKGKKRQGVPLGLGGKKPKLHR
jgi:hypothetical protein